MNLDFSRIFVISLSFLSVASSFNAEMVIMCVLSWRGGWSRRCYQDDVDGNSLESFIHTWLRFLLTHTILLCTRQEPLRNWLPRCPLFRHMCWPCVFYCSFRYVEDSTGCLNVCHTTHASSWFESRPRLLHSQSLWLFLTCELVTMAEMPLHLTESWSGLCLRGNRVEPGGKPLNDCSRLCMLPS